MFFLKEVKILSSLSNISKLRLALITETESFVDRVFETLGNKEYINNPVIPNTNPPNPNTKTTKDATKENKVIVPPNELPNLNEIVNGAAKKDAEVKRDREVRKNSDAVSNLLTFL